MFNDQKFFALSPVSFFQISADCHCLGSRQKEGFSLLNSSKHAKYLLPDTSFLCHQNNFANVSMGWNKEGLELLVAAKQPFLRANHPEISRGDGVELFFDTRDVKTSGYNTRFCHHFFFLPEAVEGVLAGEITRFRTEDRHEWCDARELKVTCTRKSNSYLLQIFIPSQCLYGYDPDQFDRLGFTYRINRADGDSQHFSVTSDDYQLEQQPSLWSSLKLVK